ncbi:YadA family autotransporter adhesin [Burkholderia thailandensis]|uniref:YadA family autotransporter adhesin n=1 Tax=Burkholderia thailandensis TaxID=57975 RepID=UPI000473A8A3|nr:YadA-like family protein [Burkholderia thailandensis]AOJ48359.1 hemagglutinin [Burkholderia thailandensis]KVG17561.1 hemagglutinin [Burkholderia thailandensis]KVG17842.1 hemagglutinin [Burkholderia thailandensis]MBS2130958.1 YadA-like family protein [Burkholderia thailandensis]MCS3399248.1 YadA-like family protein [Burkholderia thailandensis]
MRGQLIAVSEFAGSNGKGPTTRVVTAASGVAARHAASGRSRPSWAKLGLMSLAVSAAMGGIAADAVAQVSYAAGFNAYAGPGGNTGSWAFYNPAFSAGALLYGTAVGNYAYANGEGSSAYGDHATAKGRIGTALGAYAEAAGDGSNAFGASARALPDFSIAIGTNAQALKDTGQSIPGREDIGTIAIGANSIAQGDNSDPLHVSAPNAFGGYTSATASGAVALGEGAASSAYYANALGSYSKASGAGAVAVGGGAEATAQGAVAIGGATSVNSATALSGYASASGINAVAIGSGAQATGSQSISIGTGNVVSGANAGAFGDPSTVTGTGSYSFGNNNTINANNAFVLGSNVTIGSGLDGSVALGNGTTVAAANPTSSATITTTSGGQLTLSGFAGANPTSVVSVGAPGAERQITNVAAGRITPTSTDAVNGSQLYAVASTIDNAVNGGGIKYFHANSTLPDSTAAGTDSVAVGPAALAYGNDSIAEGTNATAGVSGNPAVSGDVALGSGAQATGGRSLALGANASVNTAGGVALGAGSVANRAAGTYTDPITGGSFTTAFGAVSVGLEGSLRQITNVAAGTQATDAVNVGQLQGAIAQLNQSIQNITNGSNSGSNGGNGNNTGQNVSGQWITGNPSTYTPPVASGIGSTAAGSGSVASGANSVAIGDGASASGNNSVALGANSVASAPNTVSVGSVGNERTISNVAPGVNGTDAVNVNQLNSGIGNAVGQANQYTDQKVDHLRREMNGGVAAAMAVAGLPQPTAPGKSMVAIAGSTWQGQQGFALGVSTISENGKWLYKGSLTTSTRGGTGAVLGAGYQW